ncbi:hypothetical protein B4102_4063 [Heyndrickxia sporothermodurans]|uniref:Uncharacterized protein n=1 Tax=Heyndrickxia sporothermodurans TaxID=46224 RepID=A0A150KKE0_9BACI|nr:hypothetical protein B4102_4063 [Heyndrickxia sporothermodurans]
MIINYFKDILKKYVENYIQITIQMDKVLLGYVVCNFRNEVMDSG